MADFTAASSVGQGRVNAIWVIDLAEVSLVCMAVYAFPLERLFSSDFRDDALVNVMAGGTTALGLANPPCAAGCRALLARPDF